MDLRKSHKPTTASNWSLSKVTKNLYSLAIRATPPLWESDEEELSPQPRSSISIADNEVQKLLDRLNKENKSLAGDPKSVIVANGSIQTGPATLQSLTSFYSVDSVKVTIDDPQVLEFWNQFLLYDPHSQVTKMPHLLTAKTRSYPIPPHLRAQVWARFCLVNVEETSKLYKSLVAKETSSEKLIERYFLLKSDIGRTFPQADLFKDEGGVGQQRLFRVLKAYSLYDQEVGYCQGLSFCVGPLLMQKMSEEEAFGILIQLMGKSPGSKGSIHFPHAIAKKFGVRSLFTPDMSGLHLALFQHSILVRTFIPKLSKHFEKTDIVATMYASPWFLTMFSYSVPLELVFRIYDLMFIEGALLTMMRVSIALLIRNQQVLLALEDFESMLDHLKGYNLLTVYDEDFELLIKDTIEISAQITQPILEELQNRYFHVIRYVQEERRCAVAITKRELEFMKTQISDLQAKISRGDDKIKHLNIVNLDFQENVFDLRKRLAESESRRIGLENEQQDLQEKFVEMKAYLETMESDNVALRAKNDQLKRTEEAKRVLESENEFLKFEVMQLKNSNGLVDKEVHHKKNRKDRHRRIEEDVGSDVHGEHANGSLNGNHNNVNEDFGGLVKNGKKSHSNGKENADENRDESANGTYKPNIDE